MTVSAEVSEQDGAIHHADVVLAEYEETRLAPLHTPGPGGLWRPRSSACDCPVGEACLHVAATLYRLNDLGSQAMRESPPAEWRSVLRPLLSSAPTTDAGTASLPRPLALRFDLEAGTTGAGTSRHHREIATPAHVEAGAELWLGDAAPDPGAQGRLDQGGPVLAHLRGPPRRSRVRRGPR